MSGEVTTAATTVPAGALEEFETDYVPTILPPIRWSVEKYTVAQMFALEGKTKTAISRELGISIDIINKWLKMPEFVEYIDSLVLEKATTMKAKRLRILMKALDAREARAEQEGYGDITNKDTLDIIAAINKETGDDQAAAAGYTGLLEKLIVSSTLQRQKQLPGGEG